MSATPRTVQSEVRIDILGPLRGWDGDRALDLGPLRQRALLAVLALRVNEVVTPEELLDAVWAEDLPASGVKIIAPYVYRVRQVLPGQVITRTRGGYTLRLDPAALDVCRFESAVAGGDLARKSGEPDRAAALLAQALAEFRGEPLAGLPGRYLASSRHRLCERRLKVLAERIALDLEVGRHAEIVPELVELVAAHPLNEQFAAQKMLALYRTGRQAEALGTYTTTRAALVEQLGVEPGPELRATHRTVLGDDRPITTRRDELPRDTADFVGRDTELTSVLARLSARDRSATPIVVIDGMAGVGKTAFAVRAARRLADAYPDGRLFLDLHGHTPGRSPTKPAAALDSLLRSIDVPAARIPTNLDERTALWRAELASRRLLIVLDNAADSQQIQPLLPGSPTSGALVTSRRQVSGLDGSHRVPLDVLSPSEATTLLLTIVGYRAADQHPAARRLVEACGHLPLAVRIAGARLRHRTNWTIDHLNRRLARSPLSELTSENRGVGQAFELSYRHLPADEQRTFRLLGPIPGTDFDGYAAAALTGQGFAEAESLLEALVDASLVSEPRPGRFRLHDLLRSYAELVANADESTEAFGRLLDYYLHASCRACRYTLKREPVDLSGRSVPDAIPLLSDHVEAMDWLRLDADNVIAAIDAAAAAGLDRSAYELQKAIYSYLHTTARYEQAERVVGVGLAAARRLGDPDAECYCLMRLGNLAVAAGRITEAMPHLEAARSMLPATTDAGLELVLVLYGQCALHLGRLADGLAAQYELIERTDPADPRVGSAVLGAAYATIGEIHIARGDDAAAVGPIQRAVAIAKDGKDGFRQAQFESLLASIYVRTGLAAEALTMLDDAVDRATDLALTSPLINALSRRGSALAALGRPEEALASHHLALAMVTQVDQPGVEQDVRIRLGDTLRAAGRTADAEEQYRRTVDLTATTGMRWDRARAFEGLAHCLTSAVQARHARREALAIYQAIGSARAALLANDRARS